MSERPFISSHGSFRTTRIGIASRPKIPAVNRFTKQGGAYEATNPHSNGYRSSQGETNGYNAKPSLPIPQTVLNGNGHGSFVEISDCTADKPSTLPKETLVTNGNGNFGYDDLFLLRTIYQAPKQVEEKV